MITKGSAVMVVNDADLVRRGITDVKLGSRGTVVALRPAIDDQILVKFRGKAGHVSVSPETISEVIGG